MSVVPPEILAWRKETGAERFDEMWGGVLHMVAAPNREHQDLEWALETYLRFRWARSGQGKVYHQINVAPPGGWPRNYRIPDLVLLTPTTRALDRNEYFEGPPCVVVEIMSPDDETLEKFPFYASLGVPEIWVVERDSKTPAIHRLNGPEYAATQPDPGGWVASQVTPIQLRAAGGKLEIRLQTDETTRELLP